MDDIKETTQKLTKNGFLQHVFNFDSDTKKYLMNTTQYALLSLGPVIFLNKLLEDLISDFDDTKGNIELLAEVTSHIVGLVTGIFFIHRLITYIPTYSGIAYENINLFSIIVALAVGLYNTQSKLGLKMKLIGERLGELWNGKDEKGKDDKKKKRGPCFKFVYPISYTMGDGSVISGNDRKEICTKMRAYFEQNGKPKTRKDKPQLNFPVQILIFDENKKVITKDLASYDDLKLAWESCKGKKGDKGNGDRKG